MKKDLGLTEKEISTMIVSNLKEMINNPKYFYCSTVDSAYSKINKDGEEYLIKIMSVYLPLLSDAVNENLKQLAKETVWDTLKEDSE